MFPTTIRAMNGQAVPGHNIRKFLSLDDFRELTASGGSSGCLIVQFFSSHSEMSTHPNVNFANFSTYPNFARVDFYSVNIDDQLDIRDDQNLRYVPCYKFFKRESGVIVVHSFPGPGQSAQSGQHLLTFIQSHAEVTLHKAACSA